VIMEVTLPDLFRDGESLMLWSRVVPQLSLKNPLRCWIRFRMLFLEKRFLHDGDNSSSSILHDDDDGAGSYGVPCRHVDSMQQMFQTAMMQRIIQSTMPGFQQHVMPRSEFQQQVIPQYQQQAMHQYQQQVIALITTSTDGGITNSK